ncbi:hypothetical protein PYW07_000515 [Mythimna separata]|uniref:Protein kinase domain-containing protein n=1 Tax=Mythimna separata TaxID=271217 RepID=A0AAD8E129_MYTSE|nr:hypothetical protein PYW07_000515 [Mythimna separata]
MNKTSFKLFSTITKVVKKYSGVGTDSQQPQTSGDSDSDPGHFEATSLGKRLSSGMSGLITKLKVQPPPPAPQPLENNPILEYFEVGSESSTAGPGLIWRVHDAYRKSDGKECSVFVFDKRIAEKLYKPKRKETMLDSIRICIMAMEKQRHPKMLQIIHALEEGTTTIAFASEPVLASLHNILNWHECHPDPGLAPPINPHPITLGPPAAQQQILNAPMVIPKHAKEYEFLDIELRYGLLQLIEALHYMHYNTHMMHRNVCPQVIIVTKRGTWKLFGLEFAENCHPNDPTDMISVPPWSIKVAKLTQPNLDFLAPEVQTSGHCSILSDMFSLGLVMCAIFNNGKPLIQANNNPMLYMKQIEFLDQQVIQVLPRVPAPLQEAVQRLLARDPHPRPTTQLLPLIKYFNIHSSKGDSEVAIAAMQFLDIVTMKDPQQKAHFYRTTLIEALPVIPAKLRWQHIWPALQSEVRTAEVLASVLQSVMWLIREANEDEFTFYMFPTIKLEIMGLVHTPKSIQASVTILENLHIIMKKCTKEEMETDILPSLFHALDSNTFQIQAASLIATQNICDTVEDKALHASLLNKVKALLERNQSDVKIISLILCFFEKTVVRLDRSHILEQVIPTLLAMRLSDPDIVTRVVKLYKNLLMERKFGLNTNVMATKMIPSLAPQTVNPALNIDQFTNLMEILYDMLESIDRQQRYKLKADNLALPSPERRHKLRHQMSTDNMNAPPFNIPNLRVERKTSSAEDMARKNSMTGPPPAASASGSVGGFKSKHDEFPTCNVKTSTRQKVIDRICSGSGIGQWFFGSSNSTNNDNNFLRVSNAFPNRRLSDNTLMTPKIRIAPSCASSPGGTPGGTSGLPTRRHSSIGPQERRGSNVNLSPPTGGSMPNTSSSVPFLLTSSMQSIRSRRPSACSSQGSGLLQQISSGMYQLFSGRT